MEDSVKEAGVFPKTSFNLKLWFHFSSDTILSPVRFLFLFSSLISKGRNTFSGRYGRENQTLPRMLHVKDKNLLQTPWVNDIEM